MCLDIFMALLVLVMCLNVPFVAKICICFA